MRATNTCDEHFPIFFQFEFAYSLYGAECFERSRFLFNDVVQGVVRENQISGDCLAFGDLLAELLQGVEKSFFEGDGFVRAYQAIFVAAFLGGEDELFRLLIFR